MSTSLTTTLFGSFISPDIARQVILSHVGATRPILALLMARGAERMAGNYEFKWTTDTLPGRRTAINNGDDDYDENSTSIVVDDGTIFAPNHLILFEATNEVGLVTAVSTHTLTVVRSVGTVAAAAGSVANNAAVRNIGPAAGEGSNAPTANVGAPTSVSNYVQTFRKTVKLTGAVIRSHELIEDERARQRAKRFDEMLDDMEQMILFGAKGSTTDANSQIVRTSAGFYEFVSTYADAVDGTMTMARFHQFAEKAFAKGATEKVLAAGTTFINTLYALYDGKLRVTSSESVVGLHFTDVQTPYGVFKLVPSRAMLGDYIKDAVAIDMNQLELRYSEAPASRRDSMAPVTGRLHLRENIQDKEADAQVDEWFAEEGLQYGDESAHAICSGVTGAA